MGQERCTARVRDCAGEGVSERRVAERNEARQDAVAGDSSARDNDRSRDHADGARGQIVGVDLNRVGTRRKRDAPVAVRVEFDDRDHHTEVVEDQDRSGRAHAVLGNKAAQGLTRVGDVDGDEVEVVVGRLDRAGVDHGDLVRQRHEHSEREVRDDRDHRQAACREIDVEETAGGVAAGDQRGAVEDEDPRAGRDGVDRHRSGDVAVRGIERPVDLADRVRNAVDLELEGSGVVDHGRIDRQRDHGVERRPCGDDQLEVTDGEVESVSADSVRSGTLNERGAVERLRFDHHSRNTGGKCVEHRTGDLEGGRGGRAGEIDIEITGDRLTVEGHAARSHDESERSQGDRHTVGRGHLEGVSPLGERHEEGLVHAVEVGREVVEEVELARDRRALLVEVELAVDKDAGADEVTDDLLIGNSRGIREVEVDACDVDTARNRYALGIRDQEGRQVDAVVVDVHLNREDSSRQLDRVRAQDVRKPVVDRIARGNVVGNDEPEVGRGRVDRDRAAYHGISSQELKVQGDRCADDRNVDESRHDLTRGNARGVEEDLVVTVWKINGVESEHVRRREAFVVVVDPFDEDHLGGDRRAERIGDGSGHGASQGDDPEGDLALEETLAADRVVGDDQRRRGEADSTGGYVVGVNLKSVVPRREGDFEVTELVGLDHHHDHARSVEDQERDPSGTEPVNADISRERLTRVRNVDRNEVEIVVGGLDRPGVDHGDLVRSRDQDPGQEIRNRRNHGQVARGQVEVEQSARRVPDRHHSGAVEDDDLGVGSDGVDCHRAGHVAVSGREAPIDHSGRVGEPAHFELERTRVVDHVHVDRQRGEGVDRRSGEHSQLILVPDQIERIEAGHVRSRAQERAGPGERRRLDDHSRDRSAESVGDRTGDLEGRSPRVAADVDVERAGEEHPVDGDVTGGDHHVERTHVDVEVVVLQRVQLVGARSQRDVEEEVGAVELSAHPSERVVLTRDPGVFLGDEDLTEVRDRVAEESAAEDLLGGRRDEVEVDPGRRASKRHRLTARIGSDDGGEIELALGHDRVGARGHVDGVGTVDRDLDEGDLVEGGRIVDEEILVPVRETVQGHGPRDGPDRFEKREVEGDRSQLDREVGERRAHRGARDRRSVEPGLVEPLLEQDRVVARDVGDRPGTEIARRRVEPLKEEHRVREAGTEVVGDVPRDHGPRGVHHEGHPLSDEAGSGDRVSDDREVGRGLVRVTQGQRARVDRDQVVLRRQSDREAPARIGEEPRHNLTGRQSDGHAALSAEAVDPVSSEESRTGVGRELHEREVVVGRLHAAGVDHRQGEGEGSEQVDVVHAGHDSDHIEVAGRQQEVEGANDGERFRDQRGAAVHQDRAVGDDSVDDDRSVDRSVSAEQVEIEDPVQGRNPVEARAQGSGVVGDLDGDRGRRNVAGW